MLLLLGLATLTLWPLLGMSILPGPWAIMTDNYPEAPKYKCPSTIAPRTDNHDRALIRDRFCRERLFYECLKE